MTAHVVSVSSGTVSAYLWHLVEDEHPTRTIGLFADVNGEHEDNYRFLAEVHEHIGTPLVRLDNDGATIWDVFKAHKMLGNTRVAICARKLKFEACEAWLKANCDLSDTVLHVGIDWTERQRFYGYSDRDGKRHPGLKERWADVGVTAQALMIDHTLDKGHALAWLESIGIEPPLLTRLGFPHANCRGACIKAGAKQFKRQLRLLPDEFAWWERNEEATREVVGDYSILRDRRGGVTTPLTLRSLREQVEAEAAVTPTLFDDDDREACGCFTFEEPA